MRMSSKNTRTNRRKKGRRTSFISAYHSSVPGTWPKHCTAQTTSLRTRRVRHGCGTPSWRCRLGSCALGDTQSTGQGWIGRPPRTPSDIAETKEEHHMEVRKARVWRKRIKTIKSRNSIDFDRLDASIGRDSLYL